MQNSTEEMKIIGNSIIQSWKNVDDFWLKFWDWRTVQRGALCRSRRELSNENLLDEIGVDTAENELLQVLFKIIQYYSIVSLAAPPETRGFPPGAKAPSGGPERSLSVGLLSGAGIARAARACRAAGLHMRCKCKTVCCTNLSKVFLSCQISIMKCTNLIWQSNTSNVSNITGQHLANVNPFPARLNRIHENYHLIISLSNLVERIVATGN